MERLASQEDVVKLLKKIQLASSDNTLATICYQLRALFPECNGSETFVDLYSRLMHSQEYHQIALALVRFIVQDYCKPEQLHALQEYVNHHLLYETVYPLPKLQLRLFLTNIAAELKKIEAEVLIERFARLSLEANPDRFKSSSDYCSSLKLFEELEKEEKFGNADKLPELKKFFVEKRRNDIVESFECFYPNRGFTLGVMDVKMEETPDSPMLPKKAHYRDILIDTYKEMPEIPLGQWPPIRKVHYINLALITSDPMPRNDTYSRETVRGSIDDVMARKEPTTYTQVFPAKFTAKSRGRTVVLIEGRPACGKSTLLTKISKDWANAEVLQDVEILVLVRLRQYLGKTDIRLEDIFGLYCANSKVVSSVINKVTKDGGKGVCFLLDGLDEYGHLKNDGNLVRKLLVGQLLPNASIVMASRPAGSASLRNELRLNQHVEIIGFLKKEIIAYIEHALSETPHKAKALLKYLEKHPNISRMCYLPLHLAMIVYLFELGQQLPDAETDLYYTFTMHTIYRSFKREHSNAADDDDEDDEEEFHRLSQIPKEKMPLLKSICLLAFRSTIDQKQIFTGADILSMEDLNLPVSYRKKAFDSLGLLTVDRVIADSTLPTKCFSFLHLTLQEFLSAYHMLYHLNETEQRKVIYVYGGKDHMWVVWKFFCGLSSGKDVTMSPGFFNDAFRAIFSHNITRRVAILNMLHCAFESKNKDASVDLMVGLKGIVDVKDISLSPSDCAAVGKVTSSAHDEVKQIDLSYCHLGPEGIEALVDQLENPLQAVHLLRLRARTDHRPVGTEGAPALTKLLRKLPNLEELRLYGNQLKTTRFQYLAPVIRDMTKLQTLIVSRNDLDSDSGSHVSHILENLPQLHTFYISYNRIEDKGLGEMKPGLLKCQELKILGLRGTRLTEKSGVHLSEILANLPKLEWIELYQNRIGDDGVMDMLPGLRQAKSLQIMSLVENGICDKGAKAIASYLKETNTLREMRIYYNHGMTDVGKIAIRSAVVTRPRHLCELREAV